jgi:hypothetical protein
MALFLKKVLNNQGKTLTFPKASFSSLSDHDLSRSSFHHGHLYYFLNFPTMTYLQYLSKLQHRHLCFFSKNYTIDILSGIHTGKISTDIFTDLFILCRLSYFILDEHCFFFDH